MKKPTRSNYIRSSYVKSFENPALGVEVYKDASGLLVMGFSAKRQKPDFHFSFRTVEAVEKHVSTWLNSLQRRADEKDAQRAKAAQPHTLKVGDVLRASWGYDQTNVDYYEVTAVIGAHTVEVREIAQQAEEEGLQMAGQCVPRPGNYIGEAMRRRVNEHGGVKVFSWGVWASKIEPLLSIDDTKIFKPDHFTSYC